MRRSLLVWGWGQLATGDRRGILLIPLEIGAIAVAIVGLPFIAGTAAAALFLLATIVLAVWAGQAIQAYRRAVHRREVYGLPASDGGAIELLWLAPLVIMGSTLFWSIGGQASSPDAVLATYEEVWQRDQPADAASLFVTPLDASRLAAAWDLQGARLKNAVVAAAAASASDAAIDPDRPFDSLRWEPVATAPGSMEVRVRIVRRETVRDTFFGLVPTTSQRIVPVTDIGTIRLDVVGQPGPMGGRPLIESWRITTVEILGERLGS